jgi:hypothetical protein
VLCVLVLNTLNYNIIVSGTYKVVLGDCPCVEFAASVFEWVRHQSFVNQPPKGRGIDPRSRPYDAERKAIVAKNAQVVEIGPRVVCVAVPVVRDELPSIGKLPVVLCHGGVLVPLVLDNAFIHTYKRVILQVDTYRKTAVGPCLSPSLLLYGNAFAVR